MSSDYDDYYDDYDDWYATKFFEELERLLRARAREDEFVEKYRQHVRERADDGDGS